MAHIVDIAVGRNLRIVRKERRMTQVDVANALGITFQQVQKYERGHNRISASKMYEAAKALDVPVVTLFAGLDEGETVTVSPVDESARRELIAAVVGLPADKVRGVANFIRAFIA